MEAMKNLAYLAGLAGAVICMLSGCTGMEIGGKLWVSRVDERQESQRTHNVPLACYLWRNCTAEQQQELKGS